MQRPRWLLLLALLLPSLLLTACPRGGGGGGGGDDDDSAADDDDGAEDDDDAAADLYGPPNSWWHALLADVPSDLAGTGWANGDIANNFTFPDQFGDQVELYQFFGKVIVIDVFAYW